MKLVEDMLGQALGMAQRLVTWITCRIPDVKCIFKEKSRNSNKFGVKVGLATTLKGKMIVATTSVAGNPYDSNTQRERSR